MAKRLCGCCTQQLRLELCTRFVNTSLYTSDLFLVEFVGRGGRICTRADVLYVQVCHFKMAVMETDLVEMHHGKRRGGYSMLLLVRSNRYIVVFVKSLSSKDPMNPYFLSTAMFLVHSYVRFFW